MKKYGVRDRERAGGMCRVVVCDEEVDEVNFSAAAK